MLSQEILIGGGSLAGHAGLGEITSIAKDFFLSAAAISTSLVAFFGLKSWQRELTGKAEFKTARNLIRATYKLRNRLKDFRSVVISPGEYPDGYDPLDHSNAAEDHARAWAHVFQARWQPVWSALQEFDASALEAEALWGSMVRERTDRLGRCVSELHAATESILADKASGGEEFRADRDFAKEMRTKVFATHGNRNVMTTEIREAIAGIEEKIRPHLDRR